MHEFSSFLAPVRSWSVRLPLLAWFAIWACSIASAQEGMPVAEPAAPVAVVGSAARQLNEVLDGKRAYYAENSTELHQNIDRVLIDRFDVTYASKQVLGREHWTTATVEQRERFISAFYAFLIRTYGKTVLDFHQDGLDIKPEPRYSKDGKKALVLTSLRLEGGEPVQVNYALRETATGWLIYDVRVDGVSYLQNYRSQFDAEISAQGIESLISRLEADALTET